MDWAGWAGIAIALLGASVSWWYSRKSAKYAKRAEGAVVRISHHRRLTGVAALDSQCRAAIRAMEKYGPRCTEGTLAGSSTLHDAEPVQSLILLAREHRGLFATRANPATKLANDLEPLLTEFCNASKGSDQVEQGGAVLRTLSRFLGIISDQIRVMQESV